MGGFVGVAVAFLIQAQLSGTAAEQGFGIIVGMAVMLGLWWWVRTR
jgi:hypothetical protein